MLADFPKGCTLPALRSSVLVSSVTGGGAETIARLLSSDEVPWFRGDSWGSRPSGHEEEWTYRRSSWLLPSKPSVMSITDGSDIAPWLLFRVYYASIPIIRLVSRPEDVLRWRHAWRCDHGLPLIDGLSGLTYAQCSVTEGADLVVRMPDAYDDPTGFHNAMTSIRDFIITRVGRPQG